MNEKIKKLSIQIEFQYDIPSMLQIYNSDLNKLEDFIWNTLLDYKISDINIQPDHIIELIQIALNNAMS